MKRIAAILYASASIAILASCGSNGTRSSGGVIPEAAQPNAAVPFAKKIGIVGTGTNADLDNAVVAFMSAQKVRNAELAVSRNGKTIFSHAYTYTGLAASTTTRKTIMRLASVSKAWTSAALYDLIRAHKISTSAKVFKYLGITKPLPANATVDPRVYNITIEDMIQHESGWDDGVYPYYDPTFSMRTTALALGLKQEVSQTQYVRYQLAQPLQEAPGTHYAYCNFCYTVLGMVVAKASHMTYEQYLRREVSPRIKVTNVYLSPTIGPRLPNEVAKYYSPYTGLSAIYVTSNKQYGAPYGGDGMALEVAQGASSVATNADTMLAFMQKYLIWGVGPPQPGADWAREGSMEGTNAWSEQLPNATNYAFIINTRNYNNANAFEDLQKTLEGILSH